jgi:hypothetical protein
MTWLWLQLGVHRWTPSGANEKGPAEPTERAALTIGRLDPMHRTEAAIALISFRKYYLLSQSKI